MKLRHIKPLHESVTFRVEIDKNLQKQYTSDPENYQTVLNMAFLTGSIFSQELKKFPFYEKFVKDQLNSRNGFINFDADGDDYDSPTGIINLYIRNIVNDHFKNNFLTILNNVKDILNNHVKVGNFKFESKKDDLDKRHETDEVSAWNVIRIPILQNDFGNSENNDPEMTVSNANAEHILNILGIQDDELVGTIPHNQVNKLLMKLRNISNKTIDVNIREPEIGDNFHNFGLDRNQIETYISKLIKILEVANKKKVGVSYA